MAYITIEEILSRPLETIIKDTLRVQICATSPVNDCSMKLALISATQSLRAKLTNNGNMLFSQLENAAKKGSTLKITNSKLSDAKWLTLDNETMVTILPPNDIPEITPERCREAELSLYPPIQSIQFVEELETCCDHSNSGIGFSTAGFVTDVNVKVNVVQPSWHGRTSGGTNVSLRDDTAEVAIFISDTTKLPTTIEECDHLTILQGVISYDESIETTAETKIEVIKRSLIKRKGLIIGHGAQGSIMLIEFQPRDNQLSEITLRVKEQRLRDMIEPVIDNFPVAVSVTTANALLVDITFMKTE